MIRPQAAATLRRWRSLLVGAALIGLGLYWALGFGGVLALVGWAVVLVGLGVAITGLQRLWFLAGDGGPGIVSIVEGRITYFGPLTGGSADLSEMSGLIYDPTGRPPHWILEQPGQPALAIPINAEGAEVLFDTFASLPGLSSSRVVQVMRISGSGRTQLWRRGP